METSVRTYVPATTRTRQPPEPEGWPGGCLAIGLARRKLPERVSRQWPRTACFASSNQIWAAEFGVEAGQSEQPFDRWTGVHDAQAHRRLPHTQEHSKAGATHERD